METRVDNMFLGRNRWLKSAKDIDDILKTGVDPNALNYLEFAVREGAKQKVDVLLKHGADATCRNYEGNTLVHLCASLSCASGPSDRYERKYAGIVKSLVAHGADVNAVNDAYQTALHIATNVDNSRETFPMLIALREVGASTLVGEQGTQSNGYMVREFIRQARQEDLAEQSKKDLLAGLPWCDDRKAVEILGNAEQEWRARDAKTALLEGLGTAWKPSDCKDGTSSSISCEQKEARKRKM